MKKRPAVRGKCPAAFDELLWGGCLALLCCPSPAQAERIDFASGQALAQAGHGVEGRAAALPLDLDDVGAALFDVRGAERFESAAGAPPPAAEAPRLLRARPHAALIRRVAERYGLAKTLLHALIEVESGYRADAESPRGAKGLMQLMPAMLAHYGVRDPFDPAANIDAGAQYLRRLLDEFGMRAGLAAYNAGEGSVRKYGGVPPYPETSRFVERVLHLVDIAPQH